MLRAIDSARLLFGAHEHDYALAPALPETAIAAREAALGVSLPDAYRAFLAEHGASGAGPYYGLATFDAQDAWRAAHREQEVSADPTRPFVRTGETFPAPGAAWALDGALLLAEQGCGHQSLLVVTGAARGEVWTGYDFGMGGLTPEAADFASWYRQWLDDMLHAWASGALLSLAEKKHTTELERRAIDAARPLIEARARIADRGPHVPGAALRALGHLRLYEGASAAADEAFARAAAIMLHDQDAQHRLDRARVRRLEGRHGEALEEATAGLATGTPHHGLRHGLHTERELALLGLGRDGEAIEAMERRAEGDRSYRELHERLARAHVQRGQVDAAHHALRRAVERSIGCYAPAAEIGAAVRAGLPIPTPPLEQRLREIYDPFVEGLADRSVAEALRARRDELTTA